MQFFWFGEVYMKGVDLNLSLSSIDRLNSKEKAFCRAFAEYGNSAEAAISAGFVKNSKKSGDNLLCKSKVCTEINNICLSKKQFEKNLAEIGYRRLAFGSISDAISLLYMDKPTKEELERMDLFLISEIKKPKDGSMEIKFFDRLKAIEKLECDNKTEQAVPFYDAIMKGAEALRRDRDEN